MTNITQRNWFVVIVSSIPGLGIFLLEKRRLGLGIFFAVGFSFALFGFLPNLITWFIFGIVYIAQMAYAVALATIRATKTEITPNSNLAHPLPNKFRDNRSIATEVKKSLSAILGSDEELITAIVGLEKGTAQFIFIGVTQEHLIMSSCSNTGIPTNPQRILKDNVSWVNLKIGERNLLLTIEYEKDKKVDLHVLGKLREQAKLIVDEFPGAWSNENIVDELLSIRNESSRTRANIIYTVCVVFIVAVSYLTNGLEQPHEQMLTYLAMSLAFFIMGWPQFISLVRRLKNEPGITTTNAIASLSALSTLLLWWFSLYTMGVFLIALVKYLQNAG